MLVGESGAGKSTIAHIIGGFLTAPKGSVTIDGLDLCDSILSGGANKLPMYLNIHTL